MALTEDRIAQLPHVPGTLTYFARMAERPHTYAFDPPAGVARSNIVTEDHTLPIHDLRPVGGDVSLDEEGFALVAAPTSAADLDDEDALRRIYYPEAERLIAAATGASRVVVFDHTIRRRQWGVEDRTPGTPRQPATRIHGDYTERTRCCAAASPS